MSRYLLATALFYLLIFLSPLAYSDSSPSEQYTQCMSNVDHGTFKNSQWMVCIVQESKRQDTILNNEYQYLRRSLSEDQKSALIKAQKSWLKFREDWCRFEEASDFAPGENINYEYCMLSTTINQINLIKSQQPSHHIISLCEPMEHTVWSCRTDSKVYSVCASVDLANTMGYLQYRAGTIKEIEFRFPAVLTHPKEHFEFNLLARGASLTFRNNDYTYTIIESLHGEAIINVEKSSQLLSMIHCHASTATLTENSMIDLFSAAGIDR